MSAESVQQSSDAAERTPQTSSAPSSTPSSRGVQLMKTLAPSGYAVQRAALSVQHKGGEDSASVHEAAAQGTASGGGPMPFAAQIQRSFGSHDVSGVQAHTGGDAAKASKAMGADAYATGNHVAFGKSPDLHTAAHEAAHVVQQKAGVSLSGGVGKSGDAYEQHADAVADAVVQGQSAEPILDKMAGGGGGAQTTQRRAIQRFAVQRVDTPPSETPGGTPATTPPAFTGPRTFAAYVSHVQSTFSAELAELSTMAQDLKAKGGDAKRMDQQLVGDAERLATLKREYALAKDSLDAETRRKREGAITAAQGAVDNAGLSMPQMLEKAKSLVGQIQSGGGDSVKLKRDLELVMQGAMALASQIDPEGTGKGRALYNTIDKSENPKLISQAVAAQLPAAEQAGLAVDYRNWLRQFFRDTVMVDQTNAEIFYLRDLGIVGQRAGLSLDQVMTKVIRNMQKVDESTGQALLRNDFTLGTATPAELDAIYSGVIGSAAKTNAGANTSATGNADGRG